ncbi:hypothetical protein [Streptomyces griseofuscus]|uniref:hypothetical protein n=1 Tax=Streptomyces griseofuscus TaxID=146922 RepID=UPI001FE8A899|nr:hypothetical protein [Streptomyces griseofuscus]
MQVGVGQQLSGRLAQGVHERVVEPDEHRIARGRHRPEARKYPAGRAASPGVLAAVTSSGRAVSATVLASGPAVARPSASVPGSA